MPSEQSLVTDAADGLPREGAFPQMRSVLSQLSTPFLQDGYTLEYGVTDSREVVAVHQAFVSSVVSGDVSGALNLGSAISDATTTHISVRAPPGTSGLHSHTERDVTSWLRVNGPPRGIDLALHQTLTPQDVTRSAYSCSIHA